MSEPLKALEAARLVVDEINAVLDRSRRPLLYDIQLRKSADSITSNIRESLGRREGRERNQFLRYAKGSAEETDEHLRGNFVAGRLSEPQYWRLHNRLVVIIRMLDRMMQTTRSGDNVSKQRL